MLSKYQVYITGNFIEIKCLCVSRFLSCLYIFSVWIRFSCLEEVGSCSVTKMYVERLINSKKKPMRVLDNFVLDVYLWRTWPTSFENVARKPMTKTYLPFSNLLSSKVNT